MEFSRPEYRSGEPFPSPGDLPNPGIEPRSPTLQADSLPAEYATKYISARACFWEVHGCYPIVASNTYDESSTMEELEFNLGPGCQRASEGTSVLSLWGGAGVFCQKGRNPEGTGMEQ